MRVVVSQHIDKTTRVFAGDADEVRASLLHAYPFLVVRYAGAPVEDVVRGLDHCQSYSARVQKTPIDLQFFSKAEDVVKSFLNHDPGFEALVEAATFLSGIKPSPEAIREGLIRFDEDPVAAVLSAVGFAVDETNRKAIRNIAGLRLAKAEPEAPKPPEPQSVVAVLPDGGPVADAVARAFKDKAVEPIALGGKHTSGALLAQDPETHRRYILKPGAGHQNPAAGDHETAASQSKREAAFWAIAAAWGLGGDLPETHLLLLDNKEYAAIRLLTFDFEDFNKVRARDPGLPRRLFHLYLVSGRLHQWAALDYILGNPDRNAGNMMVRGEDVKLIDHGSAFAGADFSPYEDKYSFVPYYIRALMPADFGKLTLQQRMAAVPRLNPEASTQFGSWLQGLDPEVLSKTLHSYGIDASAALQRLTRLQEDSRHVSPDVAVMAAWM